MSGLDLAEIRAQLRANEAARRAPPRGPLQALKSLIVPAPPTPLLAPAPERRPPPAADLPVLLLEGAEPDAEPALALEPRRPAFGQRPTIGVETEAGRDGPALLLTPTFCVDASDVGEALRRLRSSLAPRGEEAAEIPFMPEDLADDEADCGQLYAALPPAPQSAPPPLPEPTPGEALLMALETRLVEEQMAFIRILAGR